MDLRERAVCVSMARVVKEPLAAEIAVETAPASERAEAERARRWLWAYEVVVILAGYWLYSWIRNSVVSSEGDAVRHARDIVQIEQSLRLYHEHILNTFVAGQPGLAYICNYYYATLHFIVTIGVGIWLYRRHPLHARQLRTSWYLMNFLALFGFKFFALAPPRLLPGGRFTDTVVTFHTWGSWGDQSVSAHSNLYAAMPSMHIGWALWVAISVIFLARRTWVRVLAGLYPVATLFVIIGTGNHYWLDAVGGAAACLSGLLVTRVVTRRPILPQVDSRDVLGQGRDSTPLDDAQDDEDGEEVAAGSGAGEELRDQGQHDRRNLLERPVTDAGQGDHPDRRRVVDQSEVAHHGFPDA
jgi:hypothetical protein